MADISPLPSTSERLKAKLREIAERPPQHVCGAWGYGQPGDTCPACELYERKRSAEARERILCALSTLDVQLMIAKAANCCVPDVRDVLREVIHVAD